MAGLHTGIEHGNDAVVAVGGIARQRGPWRTAAKAALNLQRQRISGAGVEVQRDVDMHPLDIADLGQEVELAGTEFDADRRPGAGLEGRCDACAQRADIAAGCAGGAGHWLR